MAFEDFKKLAQSIEGQRCAIIIGAGVGAPLLPLAGELAQFLQRGLPADHPNQDDSLASVAQALSTLNDPLWVKTQVQHHLQHRLADLDPKSDVWDTHLRIARLPAKVFVTTNYDDLLIRALRAIGKAPLLMVAPWMDFDADSEVPVHLHGKHSETEPLVLHLHGHIAYPETFVLTEDDYIQFLFAMAQDVDKSDQQKVMPLLPGPAKVALAWQNLLMLGYRAADINFRLLVKSAEALAKSPRTLPSPSSRMRVSVQLKPERGADDVKAMHYVEGIYLHSLSFRLFWGTALDFLRQLDRVTGEARQSLASAPRLERSTDAY